MIHDFLNLSVSFFDFFSANAALANLGDADDSSAPLDRILRMGEMIAATITAAKAFAAKFFPGNGDLVYLDQTPSMLS